MGAMPTNRMSEILTLPVKQNDLQSIINLLSYYKLITQDIDLNKQNFIKVTQNDEFIGIGAIEFYRPYGLLRSVAINPNKRKQGFASQIITKLEQRAKLENINELYLLTETAETFFTKLGYETIARGSVPTIIKNTNQFSTLCPASAAVMVKAITPLI